MEFIMDMVHHNPGEPLCQTSFLNPEKLVRYGYNGQVHKSINCAVTCQSFDPDCLPQGSSDRNWILQKQANIRQEIRLAKEAGLQVFYHIDLMVLPRLLFQKHREKLCDPQGIIDLQKEATQRLLICMLREIFQEFPQVDGLIIRVGETYLYDTPYHVGNSLIRTSAYDGSEVPVQEEQRRYVLLLNLLRQEVCVNLEKYLFFRTWDCYPDKFHANPNYYLSVTNQVLPHDKLLFSIKHTAHDFWRWQPLNPCIGIGNHRQIIEIQCQREYEGKAAHPNYVAHGVLEGFPEQEDPMGLRQAAASGKVCGIYTWCRGGGWYGPYITNELWCEIHSWIFGHWARNPPQREETLFYRFCQEELGLSQEDSTLFRKLCLTASQAVLKGRYCGEYEKDARRKGLQPSNWMRDDRLGGEVQMKPMLDYLTQTGKWPLALEEKQQSVTLWKECVTLAEQIQTGPDSFRQWVITSSIYGQNLYQVVRCIWELFGSQKPKEALLADYQEAWAQYRQTARLSQCATLYKPVYFHLPGTPEVPGIGEDIQKMMENH